MTLENQKAAGALLFVAGVLGVLGIIVAEAFYPGYSTSENYISDLGVGPSSVIFNASLFLLGLLVLCAAYFINRAFGSRLFSILTVITGVGAMGVGLFTEDAGVAHIVFSLITFLFGGLSAIVSYRLQKRPFAYFSVILGVVTLSALALFASGTFLGLGKGGMERMIAYPALLWTVGFGGHLIGNTNDARANERNKPLNVEEAHAQ